jgi:hypothetical protein
VLALCPTCLLVLRPTCSRGPTSLLVMRPTVHTAWLALRPAVRRAWPACATASRLGFMFYCSECAKSSGERLDWIFVKQGHFCFFIVSVFNFFYFFKSENLT